MKTYRILPLVLLMMALAFSFQAMAGSSQQAGKAQSTYYVH